jgi:hypothetical protein
MKLSCFRLALSKISCRFYQGRFKDAQSYSLFFPINFIAIKNWLIIIQSNLQSYWNFNPSFISLPIVILILFILFYIPITVLIISIQTRLCAL